MDAFAWYYVYGALIFWALVACYEIGLIGIVCWRHTFGPQRHVDDYVNRRPPADEPEPRAFEVIITQPRRTDSGDGSGHNGPVQE